MEWCENSMVRENIWLQEGKGKEMSWGTGKGGEERLLDGKMRVGAEWGKVKGCESKKYIKKRYIYGVEKREV